ncbi:hypothetical protein CHGG_02313 [Chaetomium globosum CBS 148.51]|uniref:Nephrocystin 3-like N-terminal domain-containing protein n=1 Tax=Chaetomium globosum (strain ATCC 6205 / CBS 148.51 / DSM 1962 / NBRC 6347 / NRRL 1970) TaxID=306901 RepID=Q2HBU1_CHAGB|nr:uncharacterized protein CHGG_02313 [Chaetomium globosum CBS 148.51]EAQ90378.1 hypothetical protein CHGG_02313 [Chaetomium globosum CBS 148.51]
MSGLEPLAALSLACNVFHVIGVARHTIRTARQVYQYGELDPALIDHATRLEDLSKRIRPATMPGANPRSTAQPKPTDQDTQLLGLANRCLNAARDLREEVNFLKGPDTKSKLVAMLKTAVKTAWRQRRLDRLGKEMLDAEQLLQTGLLTRIFERTEKAIGGLENLDSTLRLFVEEYREGRSETAELVRTEAIQTRKNVAIQIKRSIYAVTKSTIQETTRVEGSLKKHITQETAQAQRLLGKHISTAIRSRDGSRDARERAIQLEARRERFLQSLKFDRMNERRSMVAESHPQTYEWVLRDSSDAREPVDTDADHPWDSFSDWLRSTEPAYWISGKPGSGKTTLVSYLLGHSQTRAFLEQWSPSVIIVSHFFWRPGTKMQQSIRGLFCSLLHQLLDKDKEFLMGILSNNKIALDKDVETDWSYNELQSTLLDVMAHYPRPIALFLDGLDEVLPADSTLALLDVVDALRQSQRLQGKIKMCLGARREPLIQQKLWACPHLRLEHLNYTDLRRYAEDTLSIPAQYQICVPPNWKLSTYDANGHWANFSFERPPTPPDLRYWLITELVNKAEGVFLWLCLTTKMVMQALWQGQMFTDLQDRIDSLPSELGKLYADMWARANGDSEHPEHQKRAALYFQLAIKKHFTDRLTPTIATTTDMASQILGRSSYEAGFVTSLVELCKAKMRDVEIRCAGLLQVNPISETRDTSGLMPWHGDDYYDLIPYAGEEYYPGPVEFVHRTASDFLTDSVEGLMILRKNEISEWYLRQRIVAARLARCRLFRAAPFVRHRDGDEGLEKAPFSTRYSYHNSFWGHLVSINSLLHALPEGDEDNARGECEKLLRSCQQLFESGHIFREYRLLRNVEDYQEERQGPDGIQGLYEMIVKREHEFLLEAASMNLNIWPIIWAKVQDMELNKQTLSELLLHVCNIEFALYADDLWFKDGKELNSKWWDKESRSSLLAPLAIDSRLKLARLLLERGACPSTKGPQRIEGYSRFDPVYVLETPLKRLMSSAWRLERDMPLFDSNLAGDFIHLIQLLMFNGADANGEEFRVSYQVQDGHLFEEELHFRDWDGGEALVQGIEGLRFVFAYPLSAILTRMLRKWKNRFPNIDPLPETGDTVQDTPMLGRLTLILHSKATPARMCFVEEEEDLEEELLWVAREAEQILHARDRNSCGVPIPIEIQQGLSRALRRRDPEGAEEWHTSRRLFEVFQRAGMTSIYWQEWGEGCSIFGDVLLGN